MEHFKHLSHGQQSLEHLCDYADFNMMFVCSRCLWSHRSTGGHAILWHGDLSRYYHESTWISLQNDGSYPQISLPRVCYPPYLRRRVRRVTAGSVWITSVCVLTVALQKFLLALLRHSAHYPLSSSLWFIFGFQSTRPLMSLSSNLTVHKQIFVATEMAASTLIAYSFTWKFYLMWMLSEAEL